NLGIDGFHVPMQLTKYQIYEKRNQRPKQIVYIVDPFSLDKRENLYNMNQFLPYLDDSTLVTRLREYKGLSWEHYHLPYFQYSGSKEVVLAGLMEFFGIKHFKADKYKGFSASNKMW